MHRLKTSFFFLANPALNDICLEHEIPPEKSKHFLKLRDYETIIVCDDSSSMNTPIDNRGSTRWDELCLIIKVIVTIGVIFDSDDVDVYFLNRDPILKVTNPDTIDEAFRKKPRGNTPLASVLKKIFQSKLARPGQAKKLLVFIATDGEPTDENGNPDLPELKRVMTEVRQIETTYVSFLICTEDTDGVAYLSQWDKDMEHVDINDDYKTERDKIRRCHQQRDYPFSYGAYVVKAMVGAIVPELDLLNEMR